MIKTASLENSKRLYELAPEWNDTFNFWEQTDGVPEGEPYLVQPELMRMYGLWGTQELKKRTPAFDLDWLLDKLPSRTSILKVADYPEWYASRDKYEESANTASDAACLLLIKLIEQGVVKA
jgi:hypothetical protein